MKTITKGIMVLAGNVAHGLYVGWHAQPNCSENLQGRLCMGKVGIVDA